MTRDERETIFVIQCVRRCVRDPLRKIIPLGERARRGRASFLRESLWACLLRKIEGISLFSPSRYLDPRNSSRSLPACRNDMLRDVGVRGKSR